MNSDIPIVFVLFGATGDLAQKKIMPALLALASHGELAPGSKIVAFSRREWTDADYHAFIRPYLQAQKKFSEDQITAFLVSVIYSKGTFDDASSYETLKNKMETLEKDAGMKLQKIFHLAIQPEFYLRTVEGLRAAGLASSDIPSKILIEKPFGHDLASAEELEKSLEALVHIHHIYRIDHYLGKEGLQNILKERRENAGLEQRLSGEYADSVHVKLYEKIGIEGRGEFYETVGVVRDVVENHVLEMLAPVIMDIAGNEEARAQAISSLAILDQEDMKNSVVRGQYQGYLAEEDVKKDSQTETYVKIETESSCEKWKGVKIILEAGKALNEKRSAVEINFKNGTQKVFDMENAGRDAYEQVILAGIHGDTRYFVSFDEVRASWKFVEPILKFSKEVELKKYAKGRIPE